jgi:hypothetical protein
MFHFQLERMEPIHREDAHDKITRCEVKNAETPDVSLMLLRLFSRSAVEFPMRALAIEWNVSLPSMVSVLMSTLSAPS